MATAKLIINNETSVKIEGLDLDMRKKLVKKFKYEIPGAKFTPAVKLGRWDGCKQFCALGGSTYINLLPEILPMLDEAGYNIELADLREYNHIFSFDPLTATSYSHKVWPVGHGLAGQPIVLRDYQVTAINLFLSDLQSIQCLATGAGKTLTSAVLSHQCERYGRTLIIVPSKDLVKQTEADYLNLGLDVGVFFGDRKEFTKTHTICTWQSLNALFKKTKDGEAPIPFGEFIDGVVCVMVDECLAPGTMIKTPMGEVAIETLVPGDKIYSFDETSNEFIIDEVVKLHINLPKSSSAEMLEFELENGTTIQITGNHKMLTDRGWIEAQDVVEGDNIRSY